MTPTDTKTPDLREETGRLSWVWSSFYGARDLQRTDAAGMFEPAVADRFVVADVFPAVCSFDCSIGAVESHSELVFLSRRQLRVIDRLDQQNGSVSNLCDWTSEIESAETPWRVRCHSLLPARRR